MEFRNIDAEATDTLRKEKNDIQRMGDKRSNSKMGHNCLSVLVCKT